VERVIKQLSGHGNGNAQTRDMKIYKIGYASGRTRGLPIKRYGHENIKDGKKRNGFRKRIPDRGKREKGNWGKNTITSSRSRT